MLDISQDNCLQQTVTQNTRENNILDLVFTNSPSLVQKTSILPDISDHDIVLVDTLIQWKRIKPIQKKFYLHGKANSSEIENLWHTYNSSLTDEVLSSMSVDELWIGFKSTLLSAIDRHTPSRNTQPTSKLPWVA